MWWEMILRLSEILRNKALKGHWQYDKSQYCITEFAQLATSNFPSELKMECNDYKEEAPG